jgi:hypothetical protein
MKIQSASTGIIEALKNKERITAKDAYKRWGVMRLASIIFHFRSLGYPIATEMKRNGRTKFAEYRLA